MFHLPSGLGVPEWRLSFDHLGSTWVLFQIVAIVMLTAALWLLPRWEAGTARALRRRRPLRVVGPRPAARHLRIV